MLHRDIRALAGAGDGGRGSRSRWAACGTSKSDIKYIMKICRHRAGTLGRWRAGDGGAPCGVSDRNRMTYHDKPMELQFRVCRDIGALAGQEMEARLAESVGGLRRGLAQARELQAALRGEAAQLEAFIPVLIQGAASGISDALKQQARPMCTPILCST